MLGWSPGKTFPESEKGIFHRSRSLRRRNVFQHSLPGKEVGLDRAVGGTEPGCVLGTREKESASSSVRSLSVDATEAWDRRIWRVRLAGWNHQRRQEDDDRKRIYRIQRFPGTVKLVNNDHLWDPQKEAVVLSVVVVCRVVKLSRSIL